MTSTASRDALLERLALREAEIARLREEIAAWKVRVAALPLRE